MHRYQKFLSIFFFFYITEGQSILIGPIDINDCQQLTQKINNSRFQGNYSTFINSSNELFTVQLVYSVLRINQSSHEEELDLKIPPRKMYAYHPDTSSDATFSLIKMLINKSQVFCNSNNDVQDAFVQHVEIKQIKNIEDFMALNKLEKEGKVSCTNKFQCIIINQEKKIYIINSP